MYNWLREKADEYYIECRDGIDNIEQWSKRDSLVGFLEWLEATSASPWRSVGDDSRPKDGQFIGLLFDESDGSRSMQGWTYSAGDMIAWPVCGASYWTPTPPLPKEGE